LIQNGSLGEPKRPADAIQDPPLYRNFWCPVLGGARLDWNHELHGIGLMVLHEVGDIVGAVEKAAD